ncbi:MAG: hypothetical protein U0547_07670 [Dehalococcoidia bacterium]
MTGWPGGLLGRVRGQRTGREPFTPPTPLSLELRLARIERELAATRRALEHQAALIEALTDLLTQRIEALGPSAFVQPATGGPRRRAGLGKGLGALIPSEPESTALRPAAARLALPMATGGDGTLLVRARGQRE